MSEAPGQDPAIDVGSGDLDEATEAAWASVLTRRRERFARMGVAYQTFVVPEASVTEGPRPSEGRARSSFERLRAGLDDQSSRQCVYPVEELADGRARRETFGVDEATWTAWGAWIGYRASIDALVSEVNGIRSLDTADVAWSERPARDEPSAADGQDAVLEPAATVLRPRSRPTTILTTETDETLMVMEQDDPDLPTAVIFRDSFMDAAAKFFSESFRRTVFVSSPNVVFWDLVEAEQPDVVIHEVAERRLVLAPVEPSTRDFRAVFGDLVLGDDLAASHERRSRALARAGRTEEALAASNDVLARVSPTARVMLNRARFHLALGRIPAAVEALRHATVLDPADAAAWSALGQVLIGLPGASAQATSAHVRAARTEPDQPTYWQLAMSAALRGGDLELAEAVRREAVTLHGGDGQVAHAASWVLAATGRLEEAEQAAELATREQPPSVDRLWQLASVQIRRGRLEEASRTVGQIREISPDDPDVRHYRDVLQQATAARTTTEGNHEGQR